MNRPLLSLACLSFLLAGCGGENARVVTQPTPNTLPHLAFVRAVVAPDSVPANQPVVVKIGVQISGCEGFYGFSVLTLADTAYVTPLAIGGARLAGAPAQLGDCPDIIVQPEVDCPVEFPYPGRGAIVVTGAQASGRPTRFELPVTIGDAAAPLQRYGFSVVDDSTRLGVAGAQVIVRRYDRWRFPSDTVATLTTDATGSVAWTSPCAEDSFGYRIDVIRTSYSSDRYGISPARCGVPERGILALVRSR